MRIIVITSVCIYFVFTELRSYYKSRQRRIFYVYAALLAAAYLLLVSGIEIPRLIRDVMGR